MFWRRSRPKEGEAEETDDLVKLQKQFGIKPVSDADVQAEFQSLFGAASGLSPTEESLLVGFGDDEGDEEAKILRDLQLDGVNLDDDESDGHQEAKSELRGVLEEAHRTAQENHSRQIAEMSAGPPVQQSKGGDGQRNTVVLAPANIHTLKMEALALKREGKLQEALAKFREAKQLQEQYSILGTTDNQQSASSGLTPDMGSKQHVRPPMDTLLDDVEVTDEDMQDPEFLAQLEKMGITGDNDGTDEAKTVQHRDVMQQLSALEAQIQEYKLQALRSKRQDQIADALACMRKIKELEGKCDELRASPAVSTPAPAVQNTITPEVTESIYRPTTTSTSTVVFVNSGAIPIDKTYPDSENDSVSGVEVTPEDMSDPTFAAELLNLDIENTPSIELPVLPEIVARSSIDAPKPSLPSSRSLKNAPSIDEDFLIDAFDDKSDSEEETSHLTSVLSSGSLHSILATENTVPSSEDGITKTTTTNSQIADLTAQLQKSRQTALSLKRKGDIQGALESMRRAKQIQNLIDLKQQASIGTLTQPQDPARDTKFQEVEQLLVDFGNRAMTLAKDNLSANREKSSEWLLKRKRYGAELEKLRQMRQNSLQLPPPYEIVKTSHQVDYELPFIPDDQVKVSVKSVNGLAQVAGKSVFVKFCLNFPSAPPHEGQTDVFVITSKTPFTTVVPSSQAEFVFKLARSRGTLRLFEIKKAVFEVWKPGTLFRNPELVSRAYQELTPLLTCCEVSTHIPFLGSNRKPCGGDIEIALQMHRPLKEKEIRLETVEDLVIGEYPEPIASFPEHVPMPNTSLEPAPVGTRSSATKEMASSLSRQGSVNVSKKQPTPVEDLPDNPHHVDLIVSYDVINEELEKVGVKLPSLTGPAAIEWGDRYDSLALKKQLLEIEMQTGKLTLDTYVERLHNRISADRVLISQLLASNQRLDAARVLHRIKIMQKELEGTEGA
ncbi:hypothetical protein KRP22_010258 [Phytophthora ramorum]|nr:Coiled-coil and C2 domain-containing protein 1A [Phytophthora ramorum]